MNKFIFCIKKMRTQLTLLYGKILKIKSIKIIIFIQIVTLIKAQF